MGVCDDDKNSTLSRSTDEILCPILSKFPSNRTSQSDCNHDVPGISLPNQIEMPLLGLGTTHSGGYYHETVIYALKEAGYRLIDTAKRYGVEKELGLAIKDSNVHRRELFLTSKLWPLDFGSSTREAFLGSCRRLGTEYLDLYMLHFPSIPPWFDQPKIIMEETWRAMEKLYEDGLCRAIGVSNYEQSDLEDLLDWCSIAPHVNQYEFHPYINPQQLRNFCQQKNILFTGYCPLGKGTILDMSPVEKLAIKHRKSPAQICIRWSIQNGVAAIPKSRWKHRVFENKSVFDFSLDQDDMCSLANLHDPTRKCVRLDNLEAKFSLPDGYKLNLSLGK